MHWQGIKETGQHVYSGRYKTDYDQGQEAKLTGIKNERTFQRFIKTRQNGREPWVDETSRRCDINVKQ